MMADHNEAAPAQRPCPAADRVPIPAHEEPAPSPPGTKQDNSPAALEATPDPAPRSPFGANFRPRPRPDSKIAAAMARFTRDKPMVPPPPALFVPGRFATGVPTLDPYAAIQAFTRREAGRAINPKFDGAF